MARAILRDEGRVLPVSAWCQGPFGIDGAYVGVPARLGRDGRDRDRRPRPRAGRGRRACRPPPTEIVGRVAALDELLGEDAAPPPAAAAAPAPRRAAAPTEDGVRDLRLESRIRAAARQRLAREGRLALLDDVVDAAMRRVVAR